MNNVYKALSDPTRRKILQMLRQKDMNAGDIAEHFSITKATLSRHFAVLKEADLIRGDKKATVITYSLNATVLEEALIVLMDMFGVRKEDENDF